MRQWNCTVWTRALALGRRLGWLWPLSVGVPAVVGSAVLKHRCCFQVWKPPSDGVACRGFDRFWAELNLRAATSTVVSYTITTPEIMISNLERGCMLGREPSRGTPWWLLCPLLELVIVHSFQDWVRFFCRQGRVWSSAGTEVAGQPNLAPLAAVGPGRWRLASLRHLSGKEQVDPLGSSQE